jgi:hypothetical protein
MWTLIIVTTFSQALGATVTLQQYPNKRFCENIAAQVEDLAKQKTVYLTAKADRYIVTRCVENK